MRTQLHKIFGLLLFVLSLAFAQQAAAQSELLPQGIGIYRFGYRAFQEQTERYDDHGQKVSLAAPFRKDFTGLNLLKGIGGKDLQRLIKELEKSDSFAKGTGAIVNSVDLGHMEGEVKGNIDARIFALGYGVTPKLSLFLGVPWVNASVDTSVRFVSANNNAQRIKQHFGEELLPEISDGLDKAGSITTATILSSIEAAGYGPLDHWEHSGIGDIQFGTIFGDAERHSRSIQSHYSLTTTLNIPTGYVDDPDLLTDVSIGKGYYTLSNRVSERLVLGNRAWFGLDATVGYNFSTTMEKRVPETDEGIVAAERKTTVLLDPGSDGDIGFTTAVMVPYLSPTYRIGAKRHLRDTYSGELEGNYDKLSDQSDMSQTYHQIGLKADTVTAYTRKKFFMPLILQFTAHMPIEARNSIDERYYEVQLSSFFKTPAANDSAKNLRAEKRAKRKKQRSLSH